MSFYVSARFEVRFSIEALHMEILLLCDLTNNSSILFISDLFVWWRLISDGLICNLHFIVFSSSSRFSFSYFASTIIYPSIYKSPIPIYSSSLLIAKGIKNMMAPSWMFSSCSVLSFSRCFPLQNKLKYSGFVFALMYL